MASRKNAKTAIMGAALFCTGLYEFFENLEEGDSVLKAGQKALRRTEIRGKAIQKASKSAAKQLMKEDQEEE